MAVRELLEPPRDMVAPHTIQTVMTVGVGTVMALLIVGLSVLCVRKRTPLYVLILVGGALCMFNETALDVIGHCYFPEHGDWQAYATLGRAVPAWVAFAYVAYFGGLTALWVVALRHGLTKRQIWIGLVTVESLNCLLELPPLKQDLYLYYGEQPLRIAGVFPAVWLVFNCVGSFLAATILFRARPWLTGTRLAFVPLIPPVCQHAAFWLGVPYVAAINSDASHGVRVAAALVTLSLGVLVLHTLVDLVAGRPDSRPATSPPVAEPTASPIPVLHG
jgi:hypothetical protein